MSGFGCQVFVAWNNGVRKFSIQSVHMVFQDFGRRVLRVFFSLCIGWYVGGSAPFWFHEAAPTTNYDVF